MATRENAAESVNAIFKGFEKMQLASKLYWPEEQTIQKNGNPFSWFMIFNDSTERRAEEGQRVHVAVSDCAENGVTSESSIKQKSRFIQVIDCIDITMLIVDEIQCPTLQKWAINIEITDSALQGRTIQNILHRKQKLNDDVKRHHAEKSYELYDEVAKDGASGSNPFFSAVHELHKQKGHAEA
ncbi:hypothetical protein BDY21DRAFT_359867 [Lineolata rhizophorae]|uniref:Uncharacterized protein n=1 Tax=Lineolata rhizophorae TaxID=578093 RepID=A0A6A6PDJ0_9PEZI|nr:hypothetical protein BDY21DRAFT_359867 [Lineolata rhizophorae]